MPLRNIEQVKSPRHGRHYLVEAVRVIGLRVEGVVILSHRAIIPIIGPKHTDIELNFPREHFHIDWRFVPDTLFNNALKWTSKNPDRWPWRIVIPTDKIIAKLGRLPFPFKRRPVFDKNFCFKVLEETYKDTKMAKGICPHRGIPCQTSTARDGVIVCPGHGLAWSILDGSMIPRKQLGF